MALLELASAVFQVGVGGALAVDSRVQSASGTAPSTASPSIRRRAASSQKSTWKTSSRDDVRAGDRPAEGGGRGDPGERLGERGTLPGAAAEGALELIGETDGLGGGTGRAATVAGI